jgi:hypothetical protein
MMETSGGLLSRVGEKVLGWIALAIVALLAIAIYQMPSDTKAAIWSGLWRSLAWVGLAAAVPWSAALIIRRVAQAETNWAGVGLIAGLCLVDVIAAALLMTGWPVGGWGWFAGLGALALAGTYNFLVAEYLADTAG